MKKLNAQSILFYTICGLATVLTLLLGYTMVYATKLEDKVTKQEQEIAELNQTIGEYRINEEWFEEYFDLLEEVYKGKINEAVLEERVKWLENAQNENVPIDIYDDFWLVEIVSREPFGENQYYYQIKVVGTEDYGYQVSSELFSIGELALAVEVEENYAIMIDFNN
jgi:uncharacterized coiled-coil protein SlyX